MAVITGHHKIANEICKALGIEHAKSFDLHMGKNEIVTVTVTFNAQEKDMAKLPGLFKRFKLVPIEDELVEKIDMNGEYGLVGPDDKKAYNPNGRD